MAPFMVPSMELVWLWLTSPVLFHDSCVGKPNLKTGDHQCVAGAGGGWGSGGPSMGFALFCALLAPWLCVGPQHVSPRVPPPATIYEKGEGEPHSF